MPVLLASALIITAASGGQADAAATPPCKTPEAQLADAGPPRPHRLDQLPAAALYLAVDRRIDKCPAPLIIRSSIGK